jgi:hypothetical protein
MPATRRPRPAEERAAREARRLRAASCSPKAVPKPRSPANSASPARASTSGTPASPREAWTPYAAAAFSWLSATVRVLTAPACTPRSTRIASTTPSRRLGSAVAVPASTAPGGCLSVDRVALAALAAGGAVGAVGLQHLHAVIEQEPGSARRRRCRCPPRRPSRAGRGDAATQAICGSRRCGRQTRRRPAAGRAGR